MLTVQPALCYLLRGHGFSHILCYFCPRVYCGHSLPSPLYMICLQSRMLSLMPCPSDHLDLFMGTYLGALYHSKLQWSCFTYILFCLSYPSVTDATYHSVDLKNKQKTCICSVPCKCHGGYSLCPNLAPPPVLNKPSKRVKLIAKVIKMRFIQCGYIKKRDKEIQQMTPFPSLSLGVLK